jgi:hypothetical protein
MESKYYKVNFYKIWSSVGDRIYIGSTENELSIRFANHLCEYNKNGKCSSKYVFMMYGVENCRIDLLGQHMVSSKLEQRQIERLYYEMYKLDCVNRNRPYTSDDEKKKQMKDLGKAWYDKNKNYKIHKSLSNYYKKKDEKTDCDRCGDIVCKLTLKSHQNSLKCKNKCNNLSPIYIDISQNESTHQT